MEACFLNILFEFLILSFLYWALWKLLPLARRFLNICYVLLISEQIIAYIFDVKALKMYAYSADNTTKYQLLSIFIPLLLSYFICLIWKNKKITYFKEKEF